MCKHALISALFAMIISAEVCVVPPVFNEASIGFVPSGSETILWNGMIADAIRQGFGGPVVLQGASYESQYGCEDLIKVTIRSYTLRPRRLGQRSGTLTLVAELFKGGQSDGRPISATKEGELHWGESAPFENALKSTTRALRRSLTQ